MSNLINRIRAGQPDRGGHGDEHQHQEHRAALGSGIATSIIVSSLLKSGFPTGARLHGVLRRVRRLAVIAALAALKIPNRSHSPVVETLSHPGLTGEAEVFVGRRLTPREPTT